MRLIDLCTGNPFARNMGERVMGYQICRSFQFICGTIVGREHGINSNIYDIKSEHGKQFSGKLLEGDIKPYDEKLVLDEIRKAVGNERARILTLKIDYYSDVIVILEEKEKEIFEQVIVGEDVDPYSLLESYQKLLVHLGFMPDSDRMVDNGEDLIILNFIKDIGDTKDISGVKDI